MVLLIGVGAARAWEGFLGASFGATAFPDLPASPSPPGMMIRAEGGLGRGPLGLHLGLPVTLQRATVEFGDWFPGDFVLLVPSLGARLDANPGWARIGGHVEGGVTIFRSVPVPVDSADGMPVRTWSGTETAPSVCAGLDLGARVGDDDVYAVLTVEGANAFGLGLGPQIVVRVGVSAATSP